MTDSRSDSPLSPDAVGTRTRHRVAVLGLGRAGMAYAAAVAGEPGLELAGGADPGGGARGFARGAGFAVPLEGSLAKLRERVAFESVIVCLPASERGRAVRAALAVGLAVLVDGLPATHAEEAARLEAAGRSEGARLWCGLGAPLHPLFVRAGRLLARGAIGRPHRVRAAAFVSRVFSAGAPPAGVDVMDYAVGELVALVDALLGPARAVRAGGRRLYGERLDEVHATLALEGGLEVGIDASWSVPGYPRASFVIEAEGERGTLLASDDALEAELEAACDGWPAGATRRVLADEADAMAFDAGEPSRVVAAFARALEGGEAGAIAAARALRAARTLDACRRSIARDGASEELGA